MKHKHKHHEAPRGRSLRYHTRYLSDTAVAQWDARIAAIHEARIKAVRQVILPLPVRPVRPVWSESSDPYVQHLVM